jgi:hypothetical protein
LFFCSGDGGEDGDSNAGDQEPPEPSELIEALQELENSASSDAVVRYGIFWESLLEYFRNPCSRETHPLREMFQNQRIGSVDSAKWGDCKKKQN